MKRFSILFAAALTLMLAMPASADRYLVQFKGKVSNLESTVEGLGGSVYFSHQRARVAVIDGLDADGAAILAKSKVVQDVIPNGALPMELGPDDIQGTESIDTVINSPGDPATAFFYPLQWSHPQISADVAWAEGRLGSPGVTVAILDTGIDYLHADTAGLVDLARSASFVPGDDALAAIFFPARHPITDLHYHGTHVASTVSSNAIVTAGVTSMTTLMGVKVCSVFGTCPFDSIVMGLLHAVDNGADVANMSLGGSYFKSDFPGFHSFLNRLFNFARSQGMTVVVSAGNSAADLDHDRDGYKTFCSTPSTICVSATGPSSADDVLFGPWYNIDDPASYTNYGRSAINVAAPGGNDAGFVLQACSSSSLIIPACAGGLSAVWLAGTSMASPHTAGVAALLVEDLGRDPGAIKEALEMGADDLGQSGTDPFYGKGRINVPNTVLP